MEKTKTTISYIKTDDDTIINENAIKWIRKVNDCLEICTKSLGCHGGDFDTHKICKINNLDTYNKLNKWFQETN